MKAMNSKTAHPAKPNTVLIGAAKAGTTSLYNYLIQHPEVFLPPERKEINFLGGVNKTIETEEEYLDLYKFSERYPVRMDISTSYLYESTTAQTIKDFLGEDTKIIALVRNPMNASYSLWKQMRHYGHEPLSFEEALKAEAARRKDPTTLKGWAPNYYYADRYIYTPQLQRYFDAFPIQQIKVFVYEEFFENLELGWEELCNFINISPSFRPRGFGNVYNPASAGYKSKFLHNLIHEKMPIKRLTTWAMPERLKAWLRLRLDDLNKKQDKTEVISNETYSSLRNFFISDIEILGKLLNKPLKTTWS
jgi:hypothetical protein